MWSALKNLSSTHEELDVSWEMLWRICDAVPGVMGYVDASETVVMVNRARENRYECSRRDVVGRKLRDVVGDENYRSLKPYVDRALSGECLEFQYLVAIKRGETRTCRVSFTPDLGGDGNVRGYFYASFDVTNTIDLLGGNWDCPWKQADLIRSFPVGLLVVADGQVQFANPEARRVLGITRLGRVLASDIAELLAALKERPFHHQHHFPSTQQHRVVETRSRRGEQSFVEVRSRPISWQSDEALLLVIRDVTARTNAENGLREHRARMQSVIDLSEDAIIEFDTGGIIRLFNVAAETMLEVSAQFAVGSPIDLVFQDRVFDPSGDDFTLNRLRQLADSNAPPKNCRLRQSRELQAKLFARQGKFQNSDFFVLTIRDVTAENRLVELQNRLQFEAIHKQRIDSLGTLAGGIAHELNNLLVPIMTMIELSMEDPADRPKTEVNLRRAHEAASLAARLVKQILLFSRRGEGKDMTTDVAMACHEVVDLIRVTIPSTIALRHEIRCDDLHVGIDCVQLSQVIVNLVTNAVHAIGDDKGEISIRVAVEEAPIASSGAIGRSAEAETVRISVSDTGCGISDDIRHRIFDPFFTTKNVREGTGMGLSVASGIVAAAGGTISLETAAGSGSCFSVLLPRVVELPRQFEPYGESNG